MLSWISWSFWLFVFVPLFDIWASISLYGVLGMTPLMVFFVGTGLLGGWIYSRQTASLVGRALVGFYHGGIPEDELRELVGLCIAAALLAAPGVVTDLFGFALLAPGLRRYLMAVIFDCAWGSIILDILVNLPFPGEDEDEDEDDPDPPRPDDI